MIINVKEANDQSNVITSIILKTLKKKIDGQCILAKVSKKSITLFQLGPYRCTINVKEI